jgi:hypothetical protein
VLEWLKRLFRRRTGTKPEYYPGQQFELPKKEEKPPAILYSAVAGGDTAFARAAARKLEEELNGPLSLVLGQKAAASSGPCYIFNIGPTQNSVAKGSAGTFFIPACPEDKRYIAGPIIPAVHKETYRIDDELHIHETSGEFLARDIVHPELSGHWSAGQNLDELGIFWSFNETPTEGELSAANEKFEATLLKRLKLVWQQTPDSLARYAMLRFIDKKNRAEISGKAQVDREK